MVRSPTSKRKLLTKVRRQRLRYIAILPSLITLINGLCGFAAIGFAGKGLIEVPSAGGVSLKYFAMSGYLIFIAMIADMLDGRVARMSQTTSSFGGQLDSLCDMISFGVAPAFLMLKVLKLYLASVTMHPVLFAFLNRSVWLAAGVFVACSAIRLARFNVENEEDETHHMSFLGLPTPAAAGVIASLVIFYHELLPDIAEKGTATFAVMENTLIVMLPFITLIAALLMISRIKYPHLINHYLKGKKPFAYLFWILVCLGAIWVNHQLALVISFCGFAAWGLSRYLFLTYIAKKPTNIPIENTPEPELPNI